MSSEASEQMLGLLKELSVYKLMDEDDRTCPKGQEEAEAHKGREQRRQEIMQEMQTLAYAGKTDST